MADFSPGSRRRSQVRELQRLALREAPPESLADRSFDFTLDFRDVQGVTRSAGRKGPGAVRSSDDSKHMRKGANIVVRVRVRRQMLNPDLGRARRYPGQSHTRRSASAKARD